MIKELIRQIACGICKALGGYREEGKEIVESFFPTSKKEIAYEEKMSFLIGKFPNVPIFGTYKHLLASYDDIAVFMAQDQTNEFPYNFPDFICSDFSFRLMGQFSIPGWSEVTFGVVWTDVHALNCILTEDMEFYFVEPQADKLQEELESWQGSSIRFIMI